MYVDRCQKQRPPIDAILSARLHPVDNGDITKAESMVSAANSSRVNGYLVRFRTRPINSKLHRPSPKEWLLADTSLRLSPSQFTISASIRSMWSLYAGNYKVPSTQCSSEQRRVSHFSTVSSRSLRVSLQSSQVSGQSATGVLHNLF